MSGSLIYSKRQKLDAELCPPGDLSAVGNTTTRPTSQTYPPTATRTQCTGCTSPTPKDNASPESLQKMGECSVKAKPPTSCAFPSILGLLQRNNELSSMSPETIESSPSTVSNPFDCGPGTSLSESKTKHTRWIFRPAALSVETNESNKIPQDRDSSTKQISVGGVPLSQLVSMTQVLNRKLGLPSKTSCVFEVNGIKGLVERHARQQSQQEFSVTQDVVSENEPGSSKPCQRPETTQKRRSKY